ncbi:MAG: Uma2 family endonuclease [Planctomycetota bacterium]
MYELTLDAIGDGWPHVNYLDGVMEFEMPGETHEMVKKVAARMVEAFLDETETNYHALGSFTCRIRKKEAGLEPDECYYIQNAERAGQGGLDLASDPPPDLAVEVDRRRPAASRTLIYERLRVPEVWLWQNDGRLQVMLLAEKGGYVPAEQSVAIPGFPLERLSAELARTPHAEQAQALREFRTWCREQAANG